MARFCISAGSLGFFLVPIYPLLQLFLLNKLWALKLPLRLVPSLLPLIIQCQCGHRRWDHGSAHWRDSCLGTEHCASGITRPETDDSPRGTGILLWQGMERESSPVTSWLVWLFQNSWLRSLTVAHLLCPVVLLSVTAVKELLAGVFQPSIGTWHPAVPTLALPLSALPS